MAHHVAQLRCVLEHVRCQLRTHDQALRIAQQARQGGGLGVRRQHHLAGRLQRRHQVGVDGVGEDDLGKVHRHQPRKGAPATMGLARRPMPPRSITQVMPGFIQAGGLCATATPGGVPVAMMSPGSSGMRALA